MTQDAHRARLIEAYNRHASERDASIREPWKLQERQAFLSAVQERNLQSFLEIGCGPGHDAAFFQTSGLDVTCVDLSPNMISLCRNKGLNAHAMEFANLTFSDNSFDAIWALNCLLHVPKAELPSVLSEIQRVLKPNGLFFMGVYGGVNSEGIWDKDTYEPKRFFSFFEDDAMKEVLSPWFDIVSFKTIPHSESLVFQAVVMENRGDEV